MKDSPYELQFGTAGKFPPAVQEERKQKKATGQNELAMYPFFVIYGTGRSRKAVKTVKKVVITKSISRFARNTQDCLENYRKLKNLGITVVFEKENISSADTTGELLLTILSTPAQDESHDILRR